MKVGLLARSEDRGLGIQTWEWFRHMDARALVIEPTGEPFATHPERYPGQTRVQFTDGLLPEAEVRAWLDGLDVVYTAETFYDWRLTGWADDVGCATVCHINPEFYRAREARPSAWWAPTTWRLEHLPPRTRVVPVPIALDRWPCLPEREEGAPLRWLHVVGKRAMADRNGTTSVVQAIRRVRRSHAFVLRAQESRMAAARSASHRVKVTSESVNLADYWQLYSGADAMVLPRRYGGLCLPALEAMGAGLPVVMTDTSPQADDWPVTCVASRPGRALHMSGGAIQPVDVNIRALADLMDSWADDPALFQEARDTAHAFALSHSWDTLAPLIREELARACR